jgi:Sec-independent protein translocase protein TatA
MKIIIVVWVVLLGGVLSGCGKTTGESTKTSPQSSEQNTKTTETTLQSSEQNTKTTETTSQSSEQKTKPEVKTSPSKSSTSSEVPQASDNISGVWQAMGKQDGVSSTWYFNNGQLAVNYVYHFSYIIAKNKDPYGYTVVTIKNSEGKQQHALLLKRNGSNFEGITAEGAAYNKYLADGTVPKGQIIEFTFQKNAWGSMDEAIDFYENTYKNTNNAISKDIIWENYRRNLWSLVKEGTSGNTITLHWTNISGAGGSFDQFVKNDETTVITFFDGNVGYPNHPTERYTVRNADYKVIKTEELWNQ